ncbi:endonuclease NucS [Candidatus Woesearchaeota archaeon]|nr:endonuclease NucS [Candidatus Woesearchaeota archaeon]
MLNTSDYCNLFQDSVKRGESVVIACKCRIRYSGRAESFLDTGDRLIIVKSDGTLLVHQPAGNSPINYMKTQSVHSLIMYNDKLVLKSQNSFQKENININIDRIYFFNSYKLEDGQTISIMGTEFDMSKMIYENPSIVEEGLKPVSQEEQTKYGFIDVLCTDKNGILAIIECKRYQADLNSVTQLRRYVEKLMESKGINSVRGILAAPKITQNALKMLQDWGYKFAKVQPPKLYEEFDKKQQRLDFF